MKPQLLPAFFQQCLQTAPTRLLPDNVWVAFGEQIYSLPETENMELVIAGAFEAETKIYCSALNSETNALVAFEPFDISPEICLRIAAPDFWINHFGERWWSQKGQAKVSRLIWRDSLQHECVVPIIAAKRAAWSIDDALPLMAVIEPEEDDNSDAGSPGDDLRAIGYSEFIDTEFARPESLLGPWLTVPGLAMIFAERGVGKTRLTSSIAFAVATGTDLFGWKAHRPRRVLIVDGEMTASDLQMIYRTIEARKGSKPASHRLAFLTADLSKNGLPDLGTEEGQQCLEQHIAGFDLVVIDNLSTLVRSGAENEADSWGIVQQWAIRQRSLGRCILLVHHAGKSGAQRGTSRREDVLGTVIQLKRPAGYSPVEGARFELHFTKTRGFSGAAAEPIEVQMEADGRWAWAPVNEAKAEAAIELHKEGETVRSIAEKLSVSTSTVSGWLRAAGILLKRGRPRREADTDTKN